MPFWSPDGRSVGFLAEGALKRIDLDGGFVRSLAAARNPAYAERGALTGRFCSEPRPVRSFASLPNGGEVRPATTLLSGQSSHRWPVFLPGGRRFLFLALGAGDVRGIYVGSLDTTEITRFDRG